MYDVNEYIVIIRAIVDLLSKAKLQQLRRLYIFIKEYLED